MPPPGPPTYSGGPPLTVKSLRYLGIYPVPTGIPRPGAVVSGGRTEPFPAISLIKPSRETADFLPSRRRYRSVRNRESFFSGDSVLTDCARRNVTRGLTVNLPSRQPPLRKQPALQNTPNFSWHAYDVRIRGAGSSVI